MLDDGLGDADFLDQAAWAGQKDRALASKTRRQPAAAVGA
jgi:hypothetical protein